MILRRTGWVGGSDTVVSAPKWCLCSPPPTLKSLTLIDREPLKRTANLPSRANPTENFSCSEMLNCSSSFCAHSSSVSSRCDSIQGFILLKPYVMWLTFEWLHIYIPHCSDMQCAVFPLWCMHMTCSNLDVVAWSIGLVWISKDDQFHMTAMIICFLTNDSNHVRKIRIPTWNWLQHFWPHT